MPPVCGALELDNKSVCRQPFFVFTETEDSGIAGELSPLTLNESVWLCTDGLATDSFSSVEA